jgi:hypothetical protein
MLKITSVSLSIYSISLPSRPIVKALGDMTTIRFAGMAAPMITRVLSDVPMLKITKYTCAPPVFEDMDAERILRVVSAGCADVLLEDPPVMSSAVRFGTVAWPLTVLGASFLTGASPAVSVGAGFLSAMAASLPVAEAQSVCPEEYMEIEVYGPAPPVDEMVMALEATVASLEAELAMYKMQVGELVNATALLFDQEAVDASVYGYLVDQIAFGDFAAVTPAVDQTISRVTDGGNAARFDVAGWPIFYEYNPEAQFFLANAGDDSLVRDMQGDVFQFPETSNEPEDVVFTLPAPPAYSGPSDLYYMPIMEIAALIETRTVSCVEVVQAFIDRLDEFDPYLGIVATPLYDRALVTAASHDLLLAAGTYLGPMMCIPFGVKDHHQIFDDEPTMYGSIAHANNVQTTKSTLITRLMDAGSIPIGKMQLGTFAWSSANAWGECMSPYLNGPGCGSSCGSASGAALGALPFSVSEETSGSIACPSSASLISGHIGSYGSLSRAGAGLLCSETDHLGFHSRYLSDYGVIFNYARTGVDPLDGDSVAQEFVNPADVDLTTLRVMIIDSVGTWIYDEEEESWTWDNGISNSYGKTGWHWAERVAAIKEKLDAAGVPYDTFSMDEARNLWSFDSDTPFHNCANPQIDVMMAAGPWAQLQECEFCFQNSKWKTYYPRNIPKKTYRYFQYCMKEMGKVFLNDDVWATYDVIIDTHSSRGGNYDSPGGSFEQWVRTAKTFVMDYYEALPCATQSGDAVEGAYSVFTAKPFEDYKNFAIGALINKFFFCVILYYFIASHL